jgi:hypothetical protein
VAALPFGRAIDQIRTTKTIKLGQRQAQVLALNTAGDFETFYADRCPQTRPDEVCLLITADGSAFPVLPGALRPAAAEAATRAAADNGWPEDPAELCKSAKRTTELICVADIPAATRTEQDALAALFGAARRAGPLPTRAGVWGQDPAIRPGGLSQCPSRHVQGELSHSRCRSTGGSHQDFSPGRRLRLTGPHPPLASPLNTSSAGPSPKALHHDGSSKPSSRSR